MKIVNRKTGKAFPAIAYPKQDFIENKEQLESLKSKIAQNFGQDPIFSKIYEMHETLEFIFLIYEPNIGPSILALPSHLKESTGFINGLISSLLNLNKSHESFQSFIDPSTIFLSTDANSDGIYPSLKIIDPKLKSIGSFIEETRVVYETMGKNEKNFGDFKTQNKDSKFMFSMGLILHFLLFDRYPFEGSSTNIIPKKLKIGEKEEMTTGEESEEAYSLMKKMLNESQEEAMQVEEAFQSDFMRKRNSETVKIVERPAWTSISALKVEVEASEKRSFEFFDDFFYGEKLDHEIFGESELMIF